MKKLVTIAVTVAVVVTLFGAYHHVKAQESGRSYSPFKGPGVPAPVVLASHTLLTTYIDQGSDDVSLGSGFTAIDNPVKINCQSAAGCTINAQTWAEVGAQTSSGNTWGICTQVDGVYSGICVYVGELPTDGSYQTSSLGNAIAVTPGTHTVQAFVFVSTAGAFLAQYSNTYHLYRP